MSNKSTFIFESASKEKFSKYISQRDGEVKLGEIIAFGKPLKRSKYLILGIEESIGPQANIGLPGSENSFSCFIMRFLNMQANRFIQGEDIVIIGTIKAIMPFQDAKSGRKSIEELDELVQSVLEEHLSIGIIPIVVGGGHNNAYPIILSVSNQFQNAINVINLDPHADCRPLEGRHSGNPFSYAKDCGALDHYTVIGLHKAYNSEFLLTYLDDQGFSYTFFEDYLEEPEKFSADVKRFNEGRGTEKPFGVELDMDSIEDMPSSAYTPNGISTSQARFYIRQLSRNTNAVYFHFPEGAPTSPNDEKVVGKILAYLIWDIISTDNL